MSKSCFFFSPLFFWKTFYLRWWSFSFSNPLVFTDPCGSTQVEIFFVRLSVSVWTRRNVPTPEEFGMEETPQIRLGFCTYIFSSLCDRRRREGRAHDRPCTKAPKPKRTITLERTGRVQCFRTSATGLCDIVHFFFPPIKPSSMFPLHIQHS